MVYSSLDWMLNLESTKNPCRLNILARNIDFVYEPAFVNDTSKDT